MTLDEFSNEFDSLINSSSIPLLSFDEYEKSVFLTNAQEIVVKGLYNGTLTGVPFERTEEMRRYINDLIKIDTPNIIEGSNYLISKSYLFEIPKDLLFIAYESVVFDDDTLDCNKGAIVEVVPITQDELHRTIDNPFRGPNNRRVLRIDVGNNCIELISKYKIGEYKISYISRPEPIILADLPDGLTINEKSKQINCKLNPAVHRVILEMAVSLALKSRSSVGKQS